jgi:hypothetical protein
MPASERQTSPAAIVIDREIIDELAKRGIGDVDARQLLGSLPPGQPILDLLEYGDQLIAKKRGKIENPPGFYISLLQRNVPLPASFLSSRKAREMEAANLAKRQAAQERQQAAERAEEEERSRIDVQIDALPAEQRQALFNQAKAQLLVSYPGMAAYFKANPDAINDGAVRGKMRQNFTRRREAR